MLGFEKSYKSGESVDSIMGYVDCLTGISNRAAFERDRAGVDDSYSLIMIDVDDFKSINDSRGHLQGDNILRRLASILSQAVAPLGRAYRFAGDEFVLVVPRREAVFLCNAIRDYMKKRESFTVSQGVVLNLNQGLTNDALTTVDSALSKSKKHGKCNITMVVPAPNQAA
jgi:diguanylate cyclase (GGDEF)-like protein